MFSCASKASGFQRETEFLHTTPNLERRDGGPLRHMQESACVKVHLF